MPPLQPMTIMGPLARPARRMLTPSLRAHISTSRASLARTRPETDKSRILEKPAKFNPPSHPSRRPKPRRFAGPDLTKREQELQATKRYPNMMPPEGTLMHFLLTNRAIHMWICLSILTSLAVYAMGRSFIETTAFADQLPTRHDWFGHPFQSLSQFLSVYKLHVMHESEVVAAKRKAKMDDAEKRKEFMRKHGVEPGFLTGSWMDRFGTMDAADAREASKGFDGRYEYEEAGGPAVQPETAEHIKRDEDRPQRRRRVWFGIW